MNNDPCKIFKKYVFRTKKLKNKQKLQFILTHPNLLDRLNCESKVKIVKGYKVGVCFRLPSENLEVQQNFNSQSESSFGNVWVHSLTLSYSPRRMKCDSWASFLAHTFTSPCLGCELKVRVMTHTYL
jgi:hypothetical protein